MEEFRKNFSVYSTMLCITALWPYDKSILGKVKRFTLSMLYLCLLAIQVSTLRWVEASLYNVLMMLSFTCPIMVYFLRYVGFTLNRPLMRAVFDSFSNDYSATKDPVELDIFARKIKEAKRVILAFLGVTAILIAYMSVLILIPTILRSEMQLQYLRIFGFFYPEMSWQTDWVSVFFILVNTMGCLSIATTESAVAVSAAYLCGLFEIASYRIEVVIDNMVHSNTSELIQVRPVVELHTRAAALVSSFRYSNYITVYSILLLAVQNPQDFANLFYSVSDIILHVLLLYLTNLSGQRVVDTSSYIFNKICSSAWYCVPLRSQKMLLFILLRSVKEMRCNVGGLYDLCYEGMSTLMSTSFSYFTVMRSMQ